MKYISCVVLKQVIFYKTNKNKYISIKTVDRIFVWVPIKKTTQGKPNECQIFYIQGSPLIDRS